MEDKRKRYNGRISSYVIVEGLDSALRRAWKLNALFSELQIVVV